MTIPLIQLDHNTEGKDYIVGDIQGCYNSLMDALNKIPFDFEKDRLFGVGDLIDRGPQSMQCAKLIYEEWFICTVGNHELMMMQTILNNNPAYRETWIGNGGEWHYEYDRDELEQIALDMNNLPLIISVGTGKNRFNIVHAELTKRFNDVIIPVTNEHVDHFNFEPWDIDDMLWGRQIVTPRQDHKTYQLMNSSTKKKYQSHDLSTTYVGHSIIPFGPIQIERQIYLDTGHVTAVNYPGGPTTRSPLTIACPVDKVFYSYTLPWKTVVKKPYSEIKKYT